MGEAFVLHAVNPTQQTGYRVFTSYRLVKFTVIPVDSVQLATPNYIQRAHS